MLRRKLMLILGGLTIMFLAMALFALWPLQGIFSDLQHISTDGAAIRDRANELNLAVNGVELELYRLQYKQTHRLDDLIDKMELLHQRADQIGEHYAMKEPTIRPVYERMRARLEVFERHVGALSTTSDPALASEHHVQSLAAAAELQADTAAIFKHAAAHLQAEQKAATVHFRWLVIGIALAFIAVINVSIMVMLRTARMILNPVDRLVAASRELAKEHFDHRVELDQHDEFDELAGAYNHLAAELQQNEQRRMEAIQHVARTLNHELNNAMTVIELKLQLIRRHSGGASVPGQHLEQIHASLKRMAGVVESLKHVKQIVLTDYTDGVKMLDLERSLTEASHRPQGPAVPR